MKIRNFALTLALAGASLAAAPSFAATSEYYPFAEIMSMKMIDKNKDGMVSKKEFMDMMSMAWDMNAGKMGVKGDNMTAEQFKEVLTYLKAGG